MRALLVVNPTATATTKRSRDVLTRALASALDLQVTETRYRGHAMRLVRRAVLGGCRLVVTLGGDGTVNEAVNGLMACRNDIEPPDFAVVPGGSANVFARALGLPADPVEATGAVLSALETGSRRMISLGWAESRYFTFCAGLGLDAEVIRAVEGLRAAGYRATPWLYVGTALRHFVAVSDRRHPAIRLERPGENPIEGLFLGVVQNTRPWTFLGSRPVNPNPLASFERGLDIFALRRLRVPSTLNQVRRFLTMRNHMLGGRYVLSLHDLPEFTLVASRPVAFQVDGDYLGERERVRFRSVPGGLRVVA